MPKFTWTRVFCSLLTKREMFSRISLVLREPLDRISPSPTAATWPRPTHHIPRKFLRNKAKARSGCKKQVWLNSGNSPTIKDTVKALSSPSNESVPFLAILLDTTVQCRLQKTNVSARGEERIFHGTKKIQSQPGRIRCPGITTRRKWRAWRGRCDGPFRLAHNVDVDALGMSCPSRHWTVVFTATGKSRLWAKEIWPLKRCGPCQTLLECCITNREGPACPWHYRKSLLCFLQALIGYSTVLKV